MNQKLRLSLMVFICGQFCGCESLDRIQRSLNSDGLTRSERLEKIRSSRLDNENAALKTTQCAQSNGTDSPQGVVRIAVSSFYDETRPIQRNVEFNFRYVRNSNLSFISDNQQITRACAAAISKMGLKTHLEKENCERCVDVYLSHEFEIKKQDNGAYTSCYNIGRNSYCYGGTDTQWFGSRYLSIVFYQTGEKEPRYSALASSTGRSNVTTRMLSKELCIAAFAGYPDRRELKEYELSYCPDPK